MDIDELDIREAGSLSGLYNHISDGVPFSFSVDEEQFAAGLVWQTEDHSHHGRLGDQRVLVCYRAGAPVGFVHTAVEDWENRRRGVIRFLGFAPGDRLVGQQLIERAELLLRNAGLDVVMAFATNYGYPFHLKATGTLSGRLPHILGLFGANGYIISPHHRYQLCQDIHFDWPHLNLSKPDSPDEALIFHKILDESAPELPKAIFRLEYNGEMVGESETWPVGRWTSVEGARELFLISIDVGDPWQGRGWGRYLLSQGLWTMQQLGYHRAGLGTNVENFRAISLYANMGFQMAGTAYSLVKQFE